MPVVVKVVVILTLAVLTSAATLTDWRLAVLTGQVNVMPDAIQVPLEPDIPDFTVYTDTEARKQAFFDYLDGFIRRENQRVTALREQLLPLHDVVMHGWPISPTERITLLAAAEEYRVDWEHLTDREVLDELLLRVDRIPAGLVLAQAANESAWGTSRFAREANNLFGQWCFTEGCGVVPRRRPADASYEVRAFDSVASAVRAYFRNINTNAAYEYLRRLRADMRRRDEPLSSLVLAYGLTPYSERGLAYVSELHAIIRFNDLYRRDQS